jgi:hypothetical protein
MFFRRSYKGQKSGLPRPSYKRGSPAKKRGISAEQVPVFTAVARGSAKSLVQVLPGVPSASNITAALRPVVRPDTVLCCDSAGSYKTAAKDLGIVVRQIPRGSNKLAPYHIQNANALHSRFKGRMSVFRGVATKHLAPYLGWVRFFDRPLEGCGGTDLSDGICALLAIRLGSGIVGLILLHAATGRFRTMISCDPVPARARRQALASLYSPRARSGR